MRFVCGVLTVGEGVGRWHKRLQRKCPLSLVGSTHKIKDGTYSERSQEVAPNKVQWIFQEK